MNPDIYKLLIVDDHPIVAEGIVSIASQQSNILCKSINPHGESAANNIRRKFRSLHYRSGTS